MMRLIVTLTVLTCVSLTQSSGLLGPLLPLATITGHAGLYSGGMTSAALLKLKAAAALAALAGLTESGFHFKVGHGYLPHEHSYHFIPHEPKGGWRKKRSTEDPTLDEVLSYDQLGCGMRLVCELASRPRSELPEDGRLILELFGRDGKAPKNLETKGKLTYTYASILGENAKDSSTCSRVYASCPYDSTTILQSVRSSGV